MPKNTDPIKPETEELPEQEVYTYEDGSQRHGVAPFPRLSPLEEAAIIKEKAPI